MTTPPLTHIDNIQDEIHSHDVIDRIAELERLAAAAKAEGEELSCEEASELADLVDLELQCTDRAPRSWKNGTVLLRMDHVIEWAAEADPLGTFAYEDVAFAGVTYYLRVG